MPRYCGVYGCNSKANKNVKKSFFRLPAARKYLDPELTRLRRLRWLAAIRREDLTELKMKYLWICEDHFISGKPADYRDIDNPDWVPSVKMGYEKKISTGHSNENLTEDAGLHKEDKASRQQVILLINGSTIISCFEPVSSQNRQRTIVDRSSAQNFPVKILPKPYPQNNKENKDINVTSQQKSFSMKEKISYISLLKNSSLIRKPNTFWGISSHSNFIVCARWNEDFTCEKRVVIESSLVVRAFLKNWEIDLSELMNISCLDDISNLLEKVESYKLP